MIFFFKTLLGAMGKDELAHVFQKSNLLFANKHKHEEQRGTA